MAAQKEDKADSKSRSAQQGEKVDKRVEEAGKEEVERKARFAAQKEIPDPEKKLKELEEKLAELQEELEKIKNQNQSYKNDKTKLETLINELKKIIESYGKVLEQIKEEESELNKYSQIKTDMIEIAVKGHEGEIDNAIKEITREIAQLEAKVDELKNDLDSAKQKYDTAQKNYEQRQKALEELKTHQQYIEGNLKKLNKLKDQVEKEEEESKYAVMYYLMKEFNTLLGNTKPFDSIERLKVALYMAWQQADAAEVALLTKESLWKEAEQAYSGGVEMLKQAQEQKREKILEKLSHIEI
jgi:chromosome segregation ATPase